MGLFKQLKEMKDMVHAAPGMIDQANQMSANAQGMAVAQQQAAYQQAAASQAAATGTLQAQPGALEATAGVSLQQYAVIVKAIAPLDYDQSALPGIAASPSSIARRGSRRTMVGTPASRVTQRSLVRSQTSTGASETWASSKTSERSARKAKKFATTRHR